MTFSEALEAYKQGKAIRRKHWDIYYLDDRREEWKMSILRQVRSLKTLEEDRWYEASDCMFSLHDVLAEDWEAYDVP